MSDNHEYNGQDYIADKIRVQSGGSGSYEAKLRIQFYERGDINNATRLKHGLGYQRPSKEDELGFFGRLWVILQGASGMGIFFSIFVSCFGVSDPTLTKVFVISIIVGILSWGLLFLDTIKKN